MATFTNQATLTYSGGTVTSNVASGEILEVLTVSKTAVTETYAAGSVLTYAVSLVNSGETDLVGLVLTDDLGAYPFGETTLVPLDADADSVKVLENGVLQPAPAVSAGPPLTVTGIRVPAGGVTTVLYAATVNAFAPPGAGGTVTNTAVISGGVAEVSASAAVSAADAPLLEMIKSVSPVLVSENGQLTYSFTIRNSGAAPAEAADAVTVTDVFDPVLSGLTVTLDGTPRTVPADYTYDEATGAFATVAGDITVPAATFTQDPVTGAWTVTPGTAVLTVTGTV